jgi:hypothetical protein
VFLDPFSDTFCASPALKLRRFVTQGLKDPYMLPSVVMVVVEDLISIFIVQIELVAGFESDVNSQNYVVGIVMDVLIQFGVCKVLGIGDVLGDIRDEAHIVDVVLNKVVIFSSIFVSVDRETLDHGMVVHVCLHSHRFTPICEHVFLNSDALALIFEGVKPRTELIIEGLFTVLREELVITIC